MNKEKRKKEEQKKKEIQKKNPRSEKKREIPGNPSVLNLLGMKYALKSSSLWNQKPFKYSFWKDPKGRNAKQNS